MSKTILCRDAKGRSPGRSIQVRASGSLPLQRQLTIRAQLLERKAWRHPCAIPREGLGVYTCRQIERGNRAGDVGSSMPKQ